jgi:hypothetical protein
MVTKSLPIFRTRRSIIMFTKFCRWVLFWSTRSWIQPTFSHPTSPRDLSIFTEWSHLQIDLTNSPFPSSYRTNIVQITNFSFYHAQSMSYRRRCRRRRHRHHYYYYFYYYYIIIIIIIITEYDEWKYFCIFNLRRARTSLELQQVLQPTKLRRRHSFHVRALVIALVDSQTCNF